MAPDDTKRGLQEVLDQTREFERSGPDSEFGQDWLARASVLLGRVDTQLKSQFDHYREFVHTNLSSQTMVAVWSNMLSLLRKGMAELETRFDPQSTPAAAANGEPLGSVGESNAPEASPEDDPLASVGADLKEMSLTSFLSLLGRLSVGSWVFLLGLLAGIWGLGVAVGGGDDPATLAVPTDACAAELEALYDLGHHLGRARMALLADREADVMQDLDRSLGALDRLEAVGYETTFVEGARQRIGRVRADMEFSRMSALTAFAKASLPPRGSSCRTE